MKKTVLAGMALFASVGLTTMTASAAGIFFDFGVDTLHDALIMPAPGPITGHLYSDIDDAHGGIQSWGVELILSGAISLDHVNWDANWFLPETQIGNNIFDARIGGLAAPPNVHLADVVFNYAGGAALIELGEYLVDTPSFDAVVAADGHVYDGEIDYLPTAVGVPEPTSVLLIGSVIGLLAVGRRKLA